MLYHLFSSICLKVLRNSVSSANVATTVLFNRRSENVSPVAALRTTLDSTRSGCIYLCIFRNRERHRERHPNELWGEKQRLSNDESTRGELCVGFRRRNRRRSFLCADPAAGQVIDRSTEMVSPSSIRRPARFVSVRKSSQAFRVSGLNSAPFAVKEAARMRSAAARKAPTNRLRSDFEKTEETTRRCWVFHFISNLHLLTCRSCAPWIRIVLKEKLHTVLDFIGEYAACHDLPRSDVLSARGCPMGQKL
jgi:hypothetical protein